MPNLTALVMWGSLVGKNLGG